MFVVPLELESLLPIADETPQKSLSCRPISIFQFLIDNNMDSLCDLPIRYVAQAKNSPIIIGVRAFGASYCLYRRPMCSTCREILLVLQTTIWTKRRHKIPFVPIIHDKVQDELHRKHEESPI